MTFGQFISYYKRKKWKKKIRAFKPIGNQEYSEVLEKETICEKNPGKKGLNDSEKTSLKKLKTLPRNCTIKINLQNMKIISKVFGMQLKKLSGKRN